MSLLHLFEFFVVSKFEAPLWVDAWTLFVSSGTESEQSELLRVGNFVGLSAGTADGFLDVIFSVRWVACSFCAT